MAEVVALLETAKAVDEAFHAKLKSAIGIIQSALHVYKESELAFSFNGGKDSTVVLHLLRAALALSEAPASAPLAGVRNVYFSTRDEFPEILDFIEECNAEYGMKLVREAGFPRGLQDTVTKYGTRAILLGTRSTDPDGRHLDAFAPCSPGWPPVMRVNPILHWTYTDVWKLLWGAQLRVAPLYMQGYTSLGSTCDSTPNPALRVPASVVASASPAPAAASTQPGEHTLQIPLTMLLANLDTDDEAVQGVIALHQATGGAAASTVTVVQAEDGCHYAPGYCLTDSDKERDGRKRRSKPRGRSASSAALEALSTVEGVLDCLRSSTCSAAGVVVVGDEVLAGRTPDANGPHIIATLAGAGLRVSRCTIVPDQRAAIATEVASLAAACRVVVTAGGVGPTHDDVTMAGVAAGMGVPLTRHAEMEAFLREWHAARGEEVTEAALRMADLPHGAVLLRRGDVGGAAAEGLEYPVVVMRNIIILPGVPSLVQAKLGMFLPLLSQGTQPLSTLELRVREPEARLAGPLASLAEQFSAAQVALGSYPVDNGHFSATASSADGSASPEVVLVLSGPPDAVAASGSQLQSALKEAGIHCM